jgi:hypothetical protein
MDAQFNVLDRGTIYVDAGRIVAVTDAAARPPADFRNVRGVDVGGTIYRA